VFETNFGLVHTPDRTKANMRAYMWDKMKADMQKRGQASLDDGDALALTFAQPVQPAEVEKEDEEEEFGGYRGGSTAGGWMR
jgi:hypothetical protein